MQSCKRNSSSSHSKSINQEEHNELNVEQIAEELKDMLCHLDDIELKLQTGVPARPQTTCRTPTSVQCEDMPQLNDASARCMWQLQQNALKLQHQMDALFECSVGAKRWLHAMERCCCNQDLEQQKAHNCCNAIESVKLRTDHDTAICLQRYKYLRDFCVEYDESKRSAWELKVLYNQCAERMQSKVMYYEVKRQIFQTLEKTEHECIYITQQLMQQSKEMEEFWMSITSRHSGRQSVEEKENKRLSRRDLPQIPTFVSFTTTVFNMI